MKPIFLTLFFLSLIALPLTGLYAQGGVGVNQSGAPADSSAILDVSSNVQGMLVPRMTNAERDAIANPAEALLIFNTTTKCFNFFKNGAWYEWCGNCIGAPAPVAGSNSPLCSGDTLELAATFIAGAVYSWTGPNGFTSNLQDPVIPGVTTAGNGVYNVVATVGGCNSNPASTTVIVHPHPSSSFNYLPASPATGQNITFTPAVSGASYNWIFQNGNPAASTLENPVVMWNTAGTYDVTLTVTQNGCNSSTTVQVTVSSSLPGSQTFNFTGAQQTFTVPAGIMQVNIECYGAQGAVGTQGNFDGIPAGTYGGVGGNGGKATGTLAVTPGQALYIYVGGQNGWNGGGSAGTGWGCSGGNGGGASDVRSGGSSLANRVIVAGGGGGGGGGATNQSCSPGSPTAGGDGSGGGSSVNGGTGSCPGGPGPGVGGYYNGSGGAGGTGSYPGTAGASGTSGQGGNGGATTFPHPPYSAGATGTGGGGGGGYNGGGGGGGSGFNGGCGAPGGGGAGGSSYTGGVTNPSTQAGVQSGNGSVVFTW